MARNKEESMETLMAKREAATGRKDKPHSDVPLVEQRRQLEQGTRKTAGEASKIFREVLSREMRKLKPN